MPLTSGTKLGVYEIVSPIGKGGMGEVYRARDTKLERDVAIKVLPEEFAQDAERLARFEREAKLLASLNHPNIASIHGFEDSDGVTAIVLELVEGPTLAERIAEGPISLEETIAIAGQMAEALEAGHEAGVIHRDLKPANVKVRQDGAVKVLDYGLAKALGGDGPIATDSELSQSPTLTRHGTQVGVILGTAAYMSPEQAKGKSVDKRTDIWAFGAVVYEMLTGQKPFDGDDVSEILASVIKSEPDWSRLPSGVPPRLLELLKLCLEKDPGRRLRDIGDARLDRIEQAPNDPSGLERKTAAAPYVIALVSAIVAGTIGWSLKPLPPEGAVARLSVTLPPEQELYFGNFRQPPTLAIAPDGRTIAYVATENGVRHLFVRALDDDVSERIDGTEGARGPFFSPDGGWLGFFAEDELRKVSLASRVPVPVCPTPGRSLGGAWPRADRIVFTAGDDTGLFQVSSEGGEPRPLTTIDSAAGELVHLWPTAVGSHILYAIHRGSDQRRSAVGSVDIDTGASKVILEGAYYAVATASGHLVYGDEVALYAAPFDIERLELTGPALPLRNDVHHSIAGASFFGVSGNGILVYASDPISELVWVDRAGRVEPLDTGFDRFMTLRLSPDGSKLAYGKGGIWVRDLETGTSVRLTDSVGTPVWRPGSEEISVMGMRDGLEQLVSVKADGSGEASFLEQDDRRWLPMTWSPDGATLIVDEIHPETQHDLWRVPHDGAAAPFVVTPANEQNARFSPDGKFVAFESDESGVLEVHVRDFPGGERKWVVSSGGGIEPVWSPVGSELFYKSGQHIMVVNVRTEPEFSASRPTPLFEAPRASGLGLFDIAPDGERFIMVRGDSAAFRELHVVINWTEELKRIVPTD